MLLRSDICYHEVLWTSIGLNFHHDFKQCRATDLQINKLTKLEPTQVDVELTTNMNSPSSHGPTGYFSSFGSRVFATLPRLVTFFANESFATLRRCFGAICNRVMNLLKAASVKSSCVINLDRDRFNFGFRSVGSGNVKTLINFINEWSSTTDWRNDGDFVTFAYCNWTFYVFLQYTI